ncbi:hypothetical protein VZT92_012901 [Zoarces viviparus]|uniref:Uncharacterized protein n=1 Tax=Zoarces viviparus TaxID=48416 RepID=A0AAW1F1Q3_ZOAVI
MFGWSSLPPEDDFAGRRLKETDLQLFQKRLISGSAGSNLCNSSNRKSADLVGGLGSSLGSDPGHWDFALSEFKLLTEGPPLLELSTALLLAK